MIKNFKKFIQIFLVAVFAVALSIGTWSLVKPQTAKAADQAVTFGSACLGDASDGTYGTSIRFDTIGQTWETYHNWVNASDWTSIADYTTINGRTVTEINNANPGVQPITLMMQPAGSFSFLRLYIPNDIMPLGDVKSMGILDGWSFNNGTTNFTTSAVTFLRTGDAMVLAQNYTTTTKLTSEDITISDAQLVHRLASIDPVNYATRGADSYVVNVNLGMKLDSEYNLMYDGYKAMRNAIYINGKSVEEWNAQAIASDAKFADASSYTFFPQNSTDPNHGAFRKPVGIWCTETGFILTVYQELVSDCETITVSIADGCYVAGKFMVAETVSKQVFTQEVVNITNALHFLDNSHNSPAEWGPTSMYYINTNGTSYWTKSPVGGCLNEADPSAAGGGQIQMKYIYFNGSSLYDINKNDNGAYGSQHGNISGVGGVYAPILVEMSTELGSSLKLTVPTGFTNGKAGHEEIIIKKGFSIYENGTSYYVNADIIFTNTGSGWTIKAKEVETEVTGIITYANRTDGGNNENFVIFQLSNNDYAGLNTTAIADISSLYGYIDIDGNLLESQPNEPFFNVWGIENSVAFRAPGLDAAGLQNVRYITIKAGAKFPAYSTQNGGVKTYYVTEEDVTFVHSVPNDTWTVGEVPSGYTVTFLVDGEDPIVVEVNEDGLCMMDIMPGNPTKAEDEMYTYEFSHWEYEDGTLVDVLDEITSDLTIHAVFTATEKPSKDITSELTFAHQGQQNAGTETYLIRTPNNYWTKAPQGGCLNEYDPQGAGGGQEQMKYIYFNGTSLYDINKNDDGSYGSSQGNIAGGGIYAPILAMMGTDKGQYSYIQLHVPTLYGGEGTTANENHKSVEIKAGFSVTEDGTTYEVTQDLKWVNVNGTWTNSNSLYDASEVTIGNLRVGGDANELYLVDITSTAWNITCNRYDFMYAGFADHRKAFLINGESVYDINENVDDSSYAYSTFPMVGTGDDATFAKPIVFDVTANTITLMIHKEYIATLGEEIVITLVAGYNKYTTGGKALAEDVNFDVIDNMLTVEVDDGTSVVTHRVLSGTNVSSFGVPTKGMTETTIFDFENWYNADTDEIVARDAVITSDIRLVAKFTETTVDRRVTEVKGIVHHLKTGTDTWMVFEFTEHDYPADVDTSPLTGGYSELLRIGFLDNIVLKGAIVLNDKTVTEATLMDVYNCYGTLEGPYFNIWGRVGTLALRVPVGSGVEEIIVEEGCSFPSYNYTNSLVPTDTRYYVNKQTTFVFNESAGAFESRGSVVVDIQMEAGAAVRLTSNLNTSGLRFQTNISKQSVLELQGKLNEGKYTSISFGTLIVPTDYLMGGLFTHDWLTKNGFNMLDIPSSFTLTAEGAYAWAKESEDYYSYFGSIVKLNTNNYARDFSGIGYILITHANGDIEYIYAEYDSTNSRSASFVAKAAHSDRSTEESEEYDNKISEGSWSPYTYDENTFLTNYFTWANGEEAIEPTTLTTLANKGGSETITITDADKQKLKGAYVELVYSTNVNVWGVFTYTDGSKTASEDFYLQAGTSNHKQFLDIYRVNGVGYGMDASTLKMTSIKFTNAELTQKTTGKVKILGFYSSDKSIDVENQEIYLTVKQNDGSEMTVGAHLGLGGALTYLAKSGIYEGVTASGYRSGNVKISTNTNDFVAERNTDWLGTSKEAGYYGHATSSKPGDGAVNLINNSDAGRQIQQSWYASVGGGTDGTNNGANGYTRARCKTESAAGKYWPYNPVQAGDVVSNPSQIIDYEINEAKGYIYVKTRAMDWAKGQRSSDKLENTVDGGVTTKSYMENYYRLNSDGTLVVNNSYIDWNGFTDMELCDWASTELPAVYPIQSLNYYVSNLDGDGSWTDGLEYNNGLGAWTGNTACRQGVRTSTDVPYTMVENWFAWANGGYGSSFALGMYIPNVNRLTSGRSRTTTALSESLNKDAKSGNVLSQKGLMSNMQPIQYTYQGAYVTNTSYTAPGIDFRMEAYVKIEYSYVICLGTVDTIRSTFKSIKDNGTITNTGNGYQKVGLDAWARADKQWTW
ncbi:MAG: hypothetical protein IKA99_08445 [Clostridia bacterium]|nr:hypothetical protein [Clostridia bacterium]